MPKFAVHVLVFNTQSWLSRFLENCGPHVDKIYIAYSKVPFTYNPRARKKFFNTFNPDDLKNSPFYKKITFIEGVWDKEEDQRNACLVQARRDGMDYLINQDHDEFFTEEGYKRLISEIIKHPNYSYYKAPWITFWKSYAYAIENEKGELKYAYPEMVYNCNKDIDFKQQRIPTQGDFLVIEDAICFHGSYVLKDAEVYEKISTWSHAHHFDRTLWFLLKWLRWDEKMQNIHPSMPKAWKRAVKYSGELPAQIADLRETKIIYYRNFFSALFRYLSVVIRANFFR